MGWKTVKEYYQIEHITRVENGLIHIGSVYIPDLIIIQPDGIVKWGSLGALNYNDLKKIFDRLSSDQEKLKSLISEPDSFERSLPIYMVDGTKVVKKEAENYGYPNITHDGKIQYENMFFESKELAVNKCKECIELHMELLNDEIISLQKDIDVKKKELDECHLALTELVI